MLRKLFMVIAILASTSCTLKIEKPWQEEVATAKKPESYAPYRYVHTNPPDKLLPPPVIIRGSANIPSYYDERELKAYSDALVAYHGYLERYIGAMEGVDGKALVKMNNEDCRIAVATIVVIPELPIRPTPPSFTAMEKSTDASLMVDYLNDLDRWIESLEDHHDNAVSIYNKQLKKIKNTCD